MTDTHINPGQLVTVDPRQPIDDSYRSAKKKPLHPLVNALREAINNRSFVDTDGDIHYCPGLSTDEIEDIILKYEKEAEQRAEEEV